MHAPLSVAELQEIVRRADKARALGSRHSFNRIADTDADLIAMRRLDRVLAIDKTARTVTVEGGITYGQLCPVLDREGLGAPQSRFAAAHLGRRRCRRPRPHGSGVNNKNLAAQIAALQFVTATGELVSLKRGDKDFHGAVVNLGALGIVSELTLDLAAAASASARTFTSICPLRCCSTISRP